ncbi:MAG: tetratricopeptide repeat protein, partial [Candidatus Eremiobacteraeota bacterium]|nr:tetratricopeptide repeat protein [Candidatus Eremiobacteraeota bacterium]
ALEDYTKFYDLTHDATALYGRGNCYLELGQAEMALADYETVVAKSGSPKTVDSAKKQIASLHRQFGTMKTSVSTVKRAQQLYEKGRELKNSGHARESLKLFDQALAVDPTFARAAIMKGDAYFLLNDLDHAIQYYRRGLTLDPEDKQGHRFLGDVLERKFQQTKDRRLLEDALRHYEAALRIDPTYGLAQECAEQARMRLKKLPK